MIPGIRNDWGTTHQRQAAPADSSGVVRSLMKVFRIGFLLAAIFLINESPLLAFTLPAPIEHDWTAYGYGVRGFSNGYTEVVFGSHHHVFQMPFFAVIEGACAAVCIGAAVTWRAQK